MVTTEPAAMKLNSPSTWPHMIVALAPMVAPRLTRVCAKLALALDFGARIVDVGEDAGRSTEHAILKCHALVDRDIVLNLAMSADRHIRADDDVLADHAVRTDLDRAKNVAEMPDRRVVADFDAIIDVDRLMNASVWETDRRRLWDLGWAVIGPCASPMQTLRRAREHPQYAQALPAIRTRGGSDLDAIKEVLALGLQRFACLQRDSDSLRLVRSGHALAAS